MKFKIVFIACAINLALYIPVGISKSIQTETIKNLAADSPGGTETSATSDEKGYRIARFSIGFVPPGAEAVRLSVEYNNRTVWEDTVLAPGEYELLVKPDTNFQEDPPPGYSRNDHIYLYLRSANYAAQWHTLERDGRELRFTDSSRLKMYRKKYAVIEYEFYQGDDSNFEGRTPTYAGTAAVGHWGNLPGFNQDWQIWQGSVDDGLWGDTLLLEFHRGTPENGMIESANEYEKMTKAPKSGYMHYGGCGTPSKAAVAGKSYYCRIVGHTESTRGYGKIRIREICDKPPQSMDVFEN